jgi:uncharacterized protein DUF669
MPKLSGETAKKVNETEGGGGQFEVLPAGKYRARLIDVESTKSAAGNPMWVWKFEVTDPSAHAGRWLWERTAIQDNTMWKIRQVFDAFGVPADTDTDDLVGSAVDLMVGQTVAQRGKMQGKTVNEIVEFLPSTSGPVSAAASKATEGSEIPF